MIFLLGQTLKKERLITFTDFLLEHFSPQNPYHRELFANGLKLYRDGYVYNVEEREGILHGTVESPHGKVHVQLDIDGHDATTCTCSSAHYCEHMFAVLYYAYATICGIGELLTKWKENNHKPKQSLKLTKPTQHHNQESSPEEWEKLFHTQYEQFQSEVIRPTPFDYYYRFLTKLLEFAPKDETQYLLYRLQMSYITLSLMYQSLDDGAVSSNFSNQHILNRLEQELNDYMDQLGNFSLESYGPLLKQLLNVVETFIEEREEIPQEVFNHYRTLWTIIAQWMPEFAKETIAFLEKEKARGIRSQWYDLKLTHLYVLLERDEEARQVVEPYLHTPSMALYWIDYHVEKEQWKEAEAWLALIHPWIRRTLAESRTRHILGHYLTYYLEIPHFAHLYDVEKVFKDLWPFSISYYENFLIDGKHYSRWVELAAYVNMDPLYERKEYIKMIEKEAPSSLLPLYHQRVMQEVHKKNRSSYKLAIRYLKKLRTLYRKQKQLEQFSRYIQGLSRSTTRLRAFQEELRKGGFIEN